MNGSFRQLKRSLVLVPFDRTHDFRLVFLYNYVFIFTVSEILARAPEQPIPQIAEFFHTYGCTHYVNGDVCLGSFSTLDTVNTEMDDPVCGYAISVCNQPPRPTQPCYPQWIGK